MSKEELRKRIGLETEAVFWHCIALAKGKTHEQAADEIMDIVEDYLKRLGVKL